MNLLITGANGFVGRHLIAEAESRKLSYFSLKRGKHNEIDVPVQKCQIVIHLAGRAHILSESSNDSREQFFDANCKFALDVAKKAFSSGMKRFIYVSSVGVYGKSSCVKILSEDDELSPVEVYAESKLAAELQLINLAEELGFELVIVRPALVYGVGAPGNIQRILKLIRNCPVIPLGERRNRRTFLSVKNLVDFLLLVGEHPSAPGQTFNIADEEAISTYELVTRLAVGMKKKRVVVGIPRFIWRYLLRALGKPKLYEQLFEDLVLDTSRARKVLGWEQPVSPRDELIKTGEMFVN